ncbi:MAG: hypothetical protein CMG21_01100 [Candidatus Marinimicrobia bacterium]|nr:hypothetical protein [Candidatus Neomarinimicrobiota bacterium]|tara:strand:- start:1078 stop:2508 length:1431 start_codon:yes stop_codon:yes gene_type:complete
MMLNHIIRRIWDSPTFTTWASFISRPLNLILLTPLILTRLSSEEVAVWLLFSIFMNFQSLADFGFNSSLIRAYSHATGGAKSIKSYKDSNIKVDTNKEINWNLIEKIYSTVKYMSLGLSILFIMLLSTFGTYSVKKLINQVNNPYEAWIAWIVIIIATGINIYGAKYSVFIKGMNKIPLFMRWQTLFSVLSILTTSIVLYISSNLLFVILIYQFWIIISVLRNYIIAYKICNNKLNTFNNVGFIYSVFNGVFPAAWRTWLAQFMSFGLIQLSGIFYAQIGDITSVSSYLFSLKIINLIKQFSNAPFYSKLPRFGKLFLLNKLEELKFEVKRAMFFSHLTFVLFFILAGFLSKPILEMIGSNTAFVDPILWFMLGVSFWIERYGAMHFQFYSLTNHVVAHIGNGISGLLYIVLVLLFFNQFQLYSFPLSYGIAYLFFYSWLGPFYSLSRFKVNFFTFELKASLIPLLFIILYLIILL